MKTDIIHVAVEPAMKAKLKQRAKYEGLSPSAMIRIVLRDYLEGRAERKEGAGK